MQYFGVPTCPYCKKRVNLIRTWNLKREGEYKCPRCGGISNIYLSPLIYVFSVLAICTGCCIYFFHKFVLDDIELFTCVYVILPFVLFYILSLFTVYLKRPVIKRVQRPEQNTQRRPLNISEDILEVQPKKNAQTDGMFSSISLNRSDSEEKKQ